MTEQQTIKGKKVWIQVNNYHIERSNPHIIPTEYFTATCYFSEPGENPGVGVLIRDEKGETKLFESPVAAISFAGKFLENQP